MGKRKNKDRASKRTAVEGHAAEAPRKRAKGATDTSGSTSSLHQILPGAILLVVAVFAVYHPALECGYIWDDPQYVVENPHLRTLGGLWKIWAFEIGEEGPRCETPQYYPLVFTSFWLEYQLYGKLNFLGFHFVNILLHALSAVILWRLLRRLEVPGAWVAAAIFAVHPVHVESVAWITERKNVLSLIFYLLSAHAYLRFALFKEDAALPSDSAKGNPFRNWNYILSLVFFVCALLSKTVTCSLPAALLLVLWWKKDRLAWRDVYLLAPFLVLGILLGLLTVFMETTHVGAQGDEWSLSFLERCLLAGRIPWFYTMKLLAPVDLIFIYPRWEIDAGRGWQYIFPFAWLAVIGVLWMLRHRLGKGPLVGVLFFVGSLFPALGFFNVFPMRFSFVADHFQYLASLGLIILGVAGMAMLIDRLLPRSDPAKIGLSAAALCVLGGLAYAQIPIYKDRVTLWQDTLERNPKAWIAHNNLGEILFSQGKVNEAMHHSRKALELKPDLPEAHGNLANAFYGKGQYEKAVEHYLLLLDLDPENIIARNNLAFTLEKLGNVDEAIERCREALAINPAHAKTHYILANLLVNHQRSYEEAVAHYTYVLEVEPNHLDAHHRLGAVLQALGRRDEARRHLNIALNLARMTGRQDLVREIEGRLN
ncbi:MAG: tetratricopeptide repeat protein [Planctomycetota bacterium]|jgi:Flp pilus assembly protein TadD